MAVGVPTIWRWPRAPAMRLVKLPDGEAFALGQIDEQALAALPAVRLGQLRQGPVERIRRQVDASRSSTSRSESPTSG